MKKNYIALELQTNQFYNPERSCNGGGYYQFYRVIKRGKVVVIIDDTSCGDFGARYDVIIFKNGKYYDNAKWDYMNNEFIRFDRKDSFSLYVDMNRIPVQRYYEYGEIEPAELKKMVLPKKETKTAEDDTDDNFDLELFIQKLMED